MCIRDSKKTGETISEFRKNWTEDKLKVIMADWDKSVMVPVVSQTDSTEEEV